ncbi:MAG: thioredoxin domain-containing protein [Nostocoides sp.]
MANRLTNATSPYLRQHADNPVNWWEWGPEAFAEATRRDVPILLSVGYAACHWCHVMAHESFEDHEVAEVINRAFVPVKVDREERPDVDAVYMSATQALTGEGGWPMTCLVTPDGAPFFAGTYLPKAQLMSLLGQAEALWQTQRTDIEDSGATIAAGLSEAVAPQRPGALGAPELAAAVAALRRDYDVVRGGFGRAPKFPPSMVLLMLTRHTARTGDPDAAAMLDGTLTAMARGGIYDQLAGGFARYSVDAGWAVPHFEKMLYDNALLARVYAHRAAMTGDPLFRRVALETAQFILRDLRTPDGGFAAALDADTLVDGRSDEGATYVWTPAQLVDVLGLQDGVAAAELLSVTDEGTFDHGASTLQLPVDAGDASWWVAVRERLTAARSLRPQPERDDKVVSSWAGLAIAALSDIGALFDRPGLVQAARDCAEFVLETHVVDGRLRRASLAGQISSAPGVLDDHGNLAEGLLALRQATNERRWLVEAGALLDAAVTHFRDEDGTWFDTADDAQALVVRPRNDTDGAEPSGRSSIASALLTFALLVDPADSARGPSGYLDLATEAVAAGAHVATSQPRFAGWTLAVAEALVAGPLQVAVVGEGVARDALAQRAREMLAGRGIVVVGVPEDPDQPLLADRPVPPGSSAAAYVCIGSTCSLPITDATALHTSLSEFCQQSSAHDRGSSPERPPYRLYPQWRTGLGHGNHHGPTAGAPP